MLNRIKEQIEAHETADNLKSDVTLLHEVTSLLEEIEAAWCGHFADINRDKALERAVLKISNMHTTFKSNEMTADEFNEWYPIGHPVTVTLDDGSIKNSNTRSIAWNLGHGNPVIKIDGLKGGYDLSRIKILETHKA